MKVSKRIIIVMLITFLFFVIATVTYHPGTNEKLGNVAVILMLMLPIEIFVLIIVLGKEIAMKLKQNKINDLEKRCVNCKMYYGEGTKYCINCGMPSAEILLEVSEYICNYFKLTNLSNKSNGSMKEYFDLLDYVFFVLPNIKKICSRNAFVMEYTKAFIIKNLSEKCMPEFLELFENDKDTKLLFEEMEKARKEIDNAYSKAKISQSKYLKAKKEIDKTYQNTKNESLYESFPRQIYEHALQLLYDKPVDLFDETVQLEIRDLIEKESKNVIKRIDVLHNSSLLQEKEYKAFYDLVYSYKRLYNDVTMDLVEMLLLKIKRKIRIVDEIKTEDIFSCDEINNLDGWAFEEWCANILKANGFVNIEVTKKCGDEGADILAEKDDVSYAIQCKCYSNPVGVSAIQEINTAKVRYNTDVAVVLTNSSFTPQAVKLANNVNVKLWGGDKLQELFNNAKNV